ncbi:hypothetical protein [Streptomyces sp. DH37]|uniref:hypothetical protein n=1 Tax=Streptomyces sp. DH37 TaxID=3040122 RepID=UPI0030148386
MTRRIPSTVHPDMWVDPDDDPRETGVETVDGRGTPLERLRCFRLAIEMKCAGPDAERMVRRSVPPSTMSLPGLVRAVMPIPHREPGVAEDMPPLDYQRVLSAVRQAAGPVTARKAGGMPAVDVSVRSRPEPLRGKPVGLTGRGRPSELPD